MTKIFISSPSQLIPAQDLATEMKKAEAVSGASAGGTGASTYVDDQGDQIQPALVTGDNGKVLFVPPGVLISPSVVTALSGTVEIVQVTTSNDFNKIDGMVADLQTGGDLAASAHVDFGDVQFVPAGGAQ